MTPSLNQQSNETAPLLDAPGYQCSSARDGSTMSSSYTELGDVSELPHAESENQVLGVTVNLDFSLFASLLGDSVPSKYLSAGRFLRYMSVMPTMSF